MHIENLEIQKEFFTIIRNKIPKNVSLVDEIADLLSISNDSAYRRLRAEKALSMLEIQLLCKHFMVSLDQVMGLQSNTLVFHGALVDKNQFNFGIYLNEILVNIQRIASLKDRVFYFEGKDIPPFHFFLFEHLAAFKYYFWQKHIIQDLGEGNREFVLEEYIAPLQSTGIRIADLYTLIPSVEIWHSDTINSTLRQIEFCRDSGYLKTESAELSLIYDDLESLIDHIEKEAANGKKFKPGADPSEGVADFKLHSNEVLLGHNTMMCDSPEQRFVYINHNVINFMITFDKKFTDYTYNSMQNILRKSSLISGVNEKERNRFFSIMRDKIRLSRSSGK
jgi:hypothetical protein